MSKATSGKKVVLNSFIYSCSGLLLKCFSFFLLPLYTIYLTTEDYGITSIATAFAGTMEFVVALSLYSAVKRFYVELKDDPKKLSCFYGTVSIFLFCSGAVFALVLYLCRELLSLYVFAGVDFYPVIFACLISMIWHCQYTLFDTILRSQQKAMKSSVLSIAFFLLTFACNILFVVVMRLGALGSILSLMVSFIAYTLYFVVEMTVKKTITWCFKWNLLKPALKYSIPILPHNLSTHIAGLVSKVLIGGTASLASVGVYTVAAQFGTLADTVQGYVSHAYGPWLYEKLHAREENYKTTIRNIAGLLCAVIGFLILGIALFAQDYILLLVDKAYADAWRYVPLIAMVFCVKTLYYFYVEILFFFKKASRILFITTLTGSLLNLALSAFMIPAYGVYGSILADAVSMVVRVGAVVIVSKRFEDVGLRLWDFIGNALMVAILICAGLLPSYLFFGNQFSLLNFGYKMLVVLLYAVFLLLRYRKSVSGMLKRFKIGRKGGK